jgi:hypothetical protein
VTDAGQAQRATGRKMAFRYAAGLGCGHLIGTADAAAIVIPLHGQFAGDAKAYFVPTSLITAAVIVVLGTVAVAAGGIANLVPVLRWFVAQQQPNSEQRRSAMRLLVRQSMILAVVWAVSGISTALRPFGSRLCWRSSSEGPRRQASACCSPSDPCGQSC